MLGLVLSNAVAGIVRERSVNATQESTTQSVRFVSGLVQNLAQQDPGQTGLTAQLAHTTDVAFTTLHQMQWYAGYEAYLPDGTIIYSDDRSLIGRKAPLTPPIQSAFTGTTGRRSSSNSTTEPHVRAMLAQYGELMEFDEPVFGPGSAQPTAILRVWIRYGHTASVISADVRKVWILLGLGLLVFYLCLFRLVASASRRLSA